MSADVAVALHWMEGHIATLELEASGHEHAWRAATCDTDRALAVDELVAVRAIQEQWREVIRRAVRPNRRRGDR